MDNQDLAQSLEVEKNLAQAANSQYLLFTYPVLWITIALLSNQESLNLAYHGQIFTALLLLSIYRDWHRRQVQDTPIKWWRYQFSFLALLNGLIWVVPTSYLVYKEGISSQSFIWLLVTSGVAIGGAASMVSIRWLSMAFCSILIVPLPLALLLHNSQDSTSAAICIFIFLGFVTRILNTFSNQFIAETSYRLELTKSEKALKDLSRRDALTGIYNRGYWNDLFHREWQRAYRYKKSLSIIMIDIDHFKKINDTFGHLVGDESIKEIAAIIEQEVPRSIDIVARFGGEEFIVLLTDTDEIGASEVAERIHSAILRPKAIERQTPNLNITASLGFSSIIPSELDQSHKLIQLADESLYLAKQTGRNKVCSIDPKLHNEQPQE